MTSEIVQIKPWWPSRLSSLCLTFHALVFYFSANTLLVQYVHNVLQITKPKCTCSRVLFFLHRFATVRFGVLLWRPGLCPGSNLATYFWEWFHCGEWHRKNFSSPDFSFAPPRRSGNYLFWPWDGPSSFFSCLYLDPKTGSLQQLVAFVDCFSFLSSVKVLHPWRRRKKEKQFIVTVRSDQFGETGLLLLLHFSLRYACCYLRVPEVLPVSLIVTAICLALLFSL